MAALEALSQSLNVQVNIVRALVRRDLYTRYSKSRMGVILVVFEPMMSILFMYALRLLLGVTYNRHGLTLPIILATGYLTHVSLRHVVLHVATTTRRNSPVLMYPRITILDSIISSSVVGWFTYTSILVILSLTAIILLNVRIPDNVPLILLSFYSSIWAGVMMGIIFGVIERFVGIFQYITAIIVRANMYLSGGMWTADEVPNHLQGYLDWNPCLHMVELMREGWVSTYHSPAANIWFVTAFCVGLTVTALGFERLTRHIKIT